MWPFDRSSPRRQEERAMHILWTILVGFAAGVVAKLIHPGRDNMGLILTTLLGIAGSFVAGYLGQALGFYQVGQSAGFIGSVIGAFLVLVVWGFIRRRAQS
jgi:uncharacterized membrane protein YeaQ/YmgE (transglycosylase-associated protein family)